MANSRWRWPRRIATLLGAIIACYLLGALTGSLIPRNQNWQPVHDGIEIFIESNGVHTEIIVPVTNDQFDWSDLIRPEHLADRALYGSHVAIGWGHAGVYRHTPRWQDLRMADALSAIFGSDDTVMHIYHLNYPQAYPHYRRSLRISRDEYARLAAAIRSSFANGAPASGYGADDLFYPARGHYNALNSCNNWTSDMLARTGIRTGLWTPFAGGVMRWIAEPQLPPISASTAGSTISITP
ncbi:MAG: TIGR02117 family protein [Parasphingorhabdus sp.]|nr:TIGR02117 family protein [Parasphingorhabdus sp.]